MPLYAGTDVPQKYMDMIPYIPEEDRISKIFYNIYFGGKVPEVYEENIKNIIEKNQDYNYRIYDEQSAECYIKRNYGDIIYSYYLRINPNYKAARSDFLRYLLIYADGGIYLDVKSSIEGPIAASIKGDEGFILTQWMNEPGQADEGVGLRKAVGNIPGGEFQQWHVIGVKGHPYLKAVIAAMLHEIDRYRPWTHLTGRIGVLNVTGPIMYTNAIYPIADLYRRKWYRYDKDASLIYNITGRDSNVNGGHYSKSKESVIIMPLHLQFLFVLYRIYLSFIWRINGKKAFPNPHY